MKLPGRVMAGRAELAGGFLFFFAAASGPQPDPRPTRDPPGQLGEHSNDHNSAVRILKIDDIFFPESSHRAAARGTVPVQFWLIPDDVL